MGAMFMDENEFSLFIRVDAVHLVSCRTGWRLVFNGEGLFCARGCSGDLICISFVGAFMNLNLICCLVEGFSMVHMCPISIIHGL